MRQTDIHELAMHCRMRLAEMDEALEQADRARKKQDKNLVMLAAAGGDPLAAGRLAGRTMRYDPKTQTYSQRWSDEITDAVEEQHAWRYYDAGKADTDFRNLRTDQLEERKLLDEAVRSSKRVIEAGHDPVIEVPDAGMDWRVAVKKIAEIESAIGSTAKPDDAGNSVAQRKF